METRLASEDTTGEQGSILHGAPFSVALFIGISSIIFYDKKMKGLKPASNNKRLWAKRKKFKKQTRLRRLRKQQLTPPKGLQWSEVT